MKKTVYFVLSLTLLFNLSSSVSATNSETKLSENPLMEEPILLSSMSELECLEFVKENGIDIPDDYEDESTWAPFVKSVISTVENNPNHVFAYSYSTTQTFACSIQNLVKNYYNDMSPLQSNLQSTGDTALIPTAIYTLQDSVIHEVWTPRMQDFNCYAYAIDYNNGVYEPGHFSGRTFSLSLGLSTHVNYIRYDLNAIGYGCIKLSTTAPQSTTFDTDDKVICYRIGDYDFHFMKLSGSNWYHKPGKSTTLRYKYVPTSARVWTDEHITNTTSYAPKYEYDSAIYFFVYAPHEYIYNYAGSGSHIVTCADCSSYKFESCSPAGNCSKCGS